MSVPPRRRPARALVALLPLALIVALAAMPPAPMAARPAEPGPRLHLHRGSLDARAPSAAAPALAAAADDLAIIQFDGPITEGRRAALTGTGAAILEYLPDYAYLVRGDPAQLAAAERLPGVYARAALLAADKLAPPLLAGLAAGRLSQPVVAALQAWPGQEAALAAGLRRLGIDPAGPLSPAELQAAARLPAARWIEPAFRPRLLNDQARAIIGADAAWADHGLYGKGQIVGLADSGLDTGDMATISPDFAGRIVATQVLSPGGDLEDENGHGTHVAGSLAGAGVQSGADPAARRYDGSIAGVAPEASLVVQAFEVGEAGQIVGGLSDDPSAIFAYAYAQGARIHSNSWGGVTGLPFIDPEGYFGGYPTQSRSTDAFVWANPDMAIFFAAGNYGNDGDFALLFCLPNGDGWIDEDSLTAPATAKNVITIGASESERLSGNLSTYTWGKFDDSCYAREPLASDLISDNAGGMAAFSSRGPADDGRIKPDLVAPGTAIVSNRSHAPGATTLWGPYAANEHYVGSGGTSMAAPIAAGAGALVREWLGRRGHPSPSAAALKAVLLNTAHDMAPGQYVVGGRQEIPAQRPNSVAGWGRVSLDFLSAPQPYTLWLDDRRAGLATGDVVRYAGAADRPLLVTSGDQPLRVMLTWTDPPPSPSAARQLVNDLDLVLIGPDGREHRGNGAASGDRVNNVEGVVLERPAPGAYRVEVRAHNVPVERQPYALAVAGALAAPPDEPALLTLINAALEVDEGTEVGIGRASLLAASSVAGPAGVRFRVERLPARGVLLLGGAPAALGAEFSQADVDAGRLAYRHDGSETTADSLGMRVEDGASPPLGGVTLQVRVRPLNDPPAAADDSANAVSGRPTLIAVLANDADPEGGALTLAAVELPAHGSVAPAAGGLAYTPAPGFVGVDSFAYTVRDPAGATARALVRVTVAAPGEPPRYTRFLPLLTR